MREELLHEAGVASTKLYITFISLFHAWLKRSHVRANQFCLGQKTKPALHGVYLLFLIHIGIKHTCVIGERVSQDIASVI